MGVSASVVKEPSTTQGPPVYCAKHNRKAHQNNTTERGLRILPNLSTNKLQRIHSLPWLFSCGAALHLLWRERGNARISYAEYRQPCEDFAELANQFRVAIVCESGQPC